MENKTAGSPNRFEICVNLRIFLRNGNRICLASAKCRCISHLHAQMWHTTTSIYESIQATQVPGKARSDVEQSGMQLKWLSGGKSWQNRSKFERFRPNPEQILTLTIYATAAVHTTPADTHTHTHFSATPGKYLPRAESHSSRATNTNKKLSNQIVCIPSYDRINK